MFNVVINNEQYDEYLAQKEKIKELEARNEFLREKYDDLYEENVDRIKKCDTLEGQVDNWKMQFESTYENYQQALSEKKVLKDENDRLLEKAKQVEASDGICEKLMKQNDALINLRELLEEKIKAKDNEISDVCGKFDNVLKERDDYRNLYLRRHIMCHKLEEQNEALKAKIDNVLKERNELKDAIAEMAEKATNPDYVKFLEAAKKFQEYDVAAHLDALEEYQPACNLNIKNLYITNNYFSEEDEDNE